MPDPLITRREGYRAIAGRNGVICSCIAAAILTALGLALPAAEGPRRPVAHARPAGTLGVLRVDGETRVLGGRQEFDEVVVTGGGAISVTAFAGGFGEGSLELVARRIRVDAGSRITADGVGYRGILEGKGEGPGGGEGGETTLWTQAAAEKSRPVFEGAGPSIEGAGPSVIDLRFASSWLLPMSAPRETPARSRGRGPGIAGTNRPLHATGSGAGGGYGGKGGDGIYLVNRGEWKGGSPYGVADGADVRLGSAGGAAPRSHHERANIKGGNGGGIIILRAEELVIDGEVTANGADGEKSEFDATGGGSGGTVLIHAPVLRLAGKVAAKGGLGGQAVDVGGSGAGGRIKVFTRDSSRPDPARLDLSPGTGPCPGEIASPRACQGTVHLERLPEAPVFLPFAGRGNCLIPPPVALALVVDTSDSMAQPARAGVAGSRLVAAKAAADALIGRLGPHDRAGAVVFNVSAQVVAPLSADRGLLRAALQSASTHSGSRLDRGLAAGGALLGSASPSEERLMVLVTDGLPDGVTDAEVADAAAAVRASGVRLVVLGYASGAEQAASAALLGRLVASAGDLLFTPSPEQLTAWWQAAAAARCPR